MLINPEFKNGDIVELVCDDTGDRGMVVVTCLEISGAIRFIVSWSDKHETPHFAPELKLVAVTTDDLIAE